MWRKYNPNPVGRTVGDCVIRALTVALSVDWETAYDMVAQAGYDMGDMPSSDSVWGAVLRQHGFYKTACENCDIAQEFCRKHPQGIYVLAFGGHVAAVKDGILYDSWDSSKEIPIYFWHRRKRGE